MAVDLCATEEADVDQSTLKVGAKEVDHGDDREGAAGEYGVADREGEAGGACADHAGFVDEGKVWCMEAECEVAGYVWLSNANEDAGMIRDAAGGGDDHDFVCGVGHVVLWVVVACVDGCRGTHGRRSIGSLCAVLVIIAVSCVLLHGS